MSEAEPILFETVSTTIQQYMHHPFLAANQIRQTVSRFHFGVARAILEAAEVPAQDALVILEAVLLLRQGLSIHDDVDKYTDRRRQLSVLAGDYDSSQYYCILARAGKLDLISLLSNAVCRVNDAKMTLLQMTPVGVLPEHYLELRETVEGELLFALARRFLGTNTVSLPQIRSIVRAYVANEDFRGARSNQHFTLRQVYTWLSEAIDRVVGPANVLLQPITAFVEEYLIPIREDLQSHTYLEGHRG